MSKINAVIYGITGLEILDNERSFFKEANPVGFILFSRNIDNPEQTKRLIAELKIMSGSDCPILIDQEGGRVARLRPPHWRKSPAMDIFANLARQNIKSAEHAVYLNYRIIGDELHNLGINVDCAPVCDLLFKDAHDIVGDRSFGSDPEIVARLARAAMEGLLDSSVLPIVKHIPGHGRAKVDSHKDLPEVSSSYADLLNSDFKAFEFLNDAPWAMTAHIKYTDIDKEFPATQSKKIINIIRQEIGFNGILLSDDLSMEALNGSFKERASSSLRAGCDIVLHCNGKMEEMEEVQSGVTALSDESSYRFDQSMALLRKPDNFDIKNAEKEINSLVS